mgnify:CR=1 FL=1
MNKKNIKTTIIDYFLLLFWPILGTSCNLNTNLTLPSTDLDSINIDKNVAQMLDSSKVLVWIEADANFARLGTAERMSTIFHKLADMGAKGIVLDVKGVAGLVSYNSSIADHLKTWNGYTQATDFDYLKNAIIEAKKAGLKVFASVDVFTEGLNYQGNKYGKIYTDTAFSNIQSQVMTTSGIIKKVSDIYTFGFLNPLQPKAQSYELSLIKEIVKNYNIDGIVLDYCRYCDICADFSDYSLNKFKEWANLPGIETTDIVQSWVTASNGLAQPKTTGIYYRKWLEFRAQTIHNFIKEAHDVVKSIKLHIAFCSYSGAWYDSYYDVGANWASYKYDPSIDFSWATPTYKNTGYAELLDLFITGNYTSTLSGSGWWTIQGEIEGANNVLRNANYHYGAIDIGNTTWNNLDNMEDAIIMLLKQTKGIMLFDLVHIDSPSNNQFNKQLYNDIKRAINIGLAK